MSDRSSTLARRRHRKWLNKKNKLFDDLVKECGFADRERLVQAIDDAEELYTTREYWDYENARYPKTLHELRGLLLRAAELLDTDGNRPTIFRALGSGEGAIERHEELLSDLFRIAELLPSSPLAAGKRGRPPRQNFYELVSELINIWEVETGSAFKFHLDEGTPGNKATFFMYAVVELIDVTRVRSLKKTIEMLRKERRRRSGSYLLSG